MFASTFGYMFSSTSLSLHPSRFEGPVVSSTCEGFNTSELDTCSINYYFEGFVPSIPIEEN